MCLGKRTAMSDAHLGRFSFSWEASQTIFNNVKNSSDGFLCMFLIWWKKAGMMLTRIRKKRLGMKGFRIKLSMLKSLTLKIPHATPNTHLDAPKRLGMMNYGCKEDVLNFNMSMPKPTDG